MEEFDLNDNTSGGLYSVVWSGFAVYAGRRVHSMVRNYVPGLFVVVSIFDDGYIDGGVYTTNCRSLEEAQSQVWKDISNFLNHF